MNRRSVVRGGVVTAAAAAVPALVNLPAAAYAKATVRTAAVGPSRQAWEQEHGRDERAGSDGWTETR